MWRLIEFYRKWMSPARWWCHTLPLLLLVALYANGIIPPHPFCSSRTPLATKGQCDLREKIELRIHHNWLKDEVIRFLTVSILDQGANDVFYGLSCLSTKVFPVCLRRSFCLFVFIYLPSMSFCPLHRFACGKMYLFYNVCSGLSFCLPACPVSTGVAFVPLWWKRELVVLHSWSFRHMKRDDCCCFFQAWPVAATLPADTPFTSIYCGAALGRFSQVVVVMVARSVIHRQWIGGACQSSFQRLVSHSSFPLLLKWCRVYGPEISLCIFLSTGCVFAHVMSLSSRGSRAVKASRLAAHTLLFSPDSGGRAENQCCVFEEKKLPSCVSWLTDRTSIRIIGFLPVFSHPWMIKRSGVRFFPQSVSWTKFVLWIRDGVEMYLKHSVLKFVQKFVQKFLQNMAEKTLFFAKEKCF